jgi:hypothetical protein
MPVQAVPIFVLAKALGFTQEHRERQKNTASSVIFHPPPPQKPPRFPDGSPAPPNEFFLPSVFRCLKSFAVTLNTEL